MFSSSIFAVSGSSWIKIDPKNPNRINDDGTGQIELLISNPTKRIDNFIIIDEDELNNVVVSEFKKQGIILNWDQRSYSITEIWNYQKDWDESWKKVQEPTNLLETIFSLIDLFFGGVPSPTDIVTFFTGTPPDWTLSTGGKFIDSLVGKKIVNLENFVKENGIIWVSPNGVGNIDLHKKILKPIIIAPTETISLIIPYSMNDNKEKSINIDIPYYYPSVKINQYYNGKETIQFNFAKSVTSPKDWGKMEPSNTPLSESPSVIYADSFDGYSPGITPPGWNVRYPGAYHAVASDKSSSAPNSFKLVGHQSGNCVMSKSIDGIQSDSELWFQANIMTKDSAYNNAIGFASGNKGPTWGNIGFTQTNKGHVISSGGATKPLTPNTWYKVTGYLNLKSRTFSSWINDEILTENSPIESSTGNPEQLTITSGNHIEGETVWYDNVKIGFGKPVEPKSEEEFTFSDHPWYIREVRWPKTEGPNANSWAKENAYVDSQDRLHLKISRGSDGIYYCSEIWSKEYFGYGKYTFYLDSKPTSLDTNAVLGLFTYDERLNDGNDNIEVSEGEGEIDIEFGDQFEQNAQYILQNTVFGQKINECKKPFTMSDDNIHSIHSFEWKPGFVNFKSYSGNTETEKSLIYKVSLSKWPEIYDFGIVNFGIFNFVPEPPAQVHMNLWLWNQNDDKSGTIPNIMGDNTEQEIIISKFVFTPA